MLLQALCPIASLGRAARQQCRRSRLAGPGLRHCGDDCTHLSLGLGHEFGVIQCFSYSPSSWTEVTVRGQAAPQRTPAVPKTPIWADPSPSGIPDTAASTAKGLLVENQGILDLLF